MDRLDDNFNVLTITHPDVENGKGCRVTIWCSGCRHHCPGCHNQHTWAYGQGKPILSEQVMQAVFDAVEPDYMQGITLSGGDPLDQSDSALEQLGEFIRLFKERFPEKDIWVYSGGIFEDLIKQVPVLRVLEQCDVLIDGPFKQELRDPDLAFRGSSNQRIIYLKQ